MKMKVNLCFIFCFKILIFRMKLNAVFPIEKTKKKKENENKNNQLKNLKELSFANSISFVLFQTTLFENVFLLQTLSLGIILPAMAF